MKIKLLLFFMAIMLATTSACSNDSNQTTNASDDSNASTQQEVTEAGISMPDTTVWYAENERNDEIGPQLPVGKYFLAVYAPGQRGKYELYGTIDRKQDDLLKKAEFSVFAEIEVTKGQLLVTEHVMIYKAKDMEKSTHTDGSFLNGVYEVGKDMPAGTYTITINADSVPASTHFAVLKDLSNEEASIIRQEQIPLNQPVTVDLLSGQYVFLRNVSAKAK